MNQLKILMLTFIFISLCQADDSLHDKVIEIGISSIDANKKNIIISVYGINTIPIAGIQLDIGDGDLFAIDSIGGGRCLKNDFTMYSNEKGRILAFSMKGNMISISKNNKKDENILLNIHGKIKKQNLAPIETINIESIIAGKKGQKLESISLPYRWENK